jgi:hypothetical protein
MEMTIDISKYYSSLTPEFTPSYTIKTSSPFINMTLQPAGKLKYNSRNNKCEVIEDGNNNL